MGTSSTRSSTYPNFFGTARLLAFASSQWISTSSTSDKAIATSVNSRDVRHSFAQYRTASRHHQKSIVVRPNARYRFSPAEVACVGTTRRWPPAQAHRHGPFCAMRRKRSSALLRRKSGFVTSCEAKTAPVRRGYPAETRIENMIDSTANDYQSKPLVKTGFCYSESRKTHRLDKLEILV